MDLNARPSPQQFQTSTFFCRRRCRRTLNRALLYRCVLFSRMFRTCDSSSLCFFSRVFKKPKRQGEMNGFSLATNHGDQSARIPRLFRLQPFPSIDPYKKETRNACLISTTFFFFFIHSITDNAFDNDFFL